MTWRERYLPRPWSQEAIGQRVGLLLLASVVSFVVLFKFGLQFLQ